MSEQGTQPRTIPVERFPGPVCSYAAHDDAPVVCSANAAFESQFGTVRRGHTLSRVFDSLRIDVVNGSDVATALARGDRFAVEYGREGERSRPETYLVEVVPPSGDGPGFLVFVEATGRELTGATAGRLDGEHIATILSHDLRNPLDVAKSRLRAGREFDEDEHFEHVEWAHERMERIIEDVLTLANVGEKPETDDVIDLASVASKAWQTVDTGDATLTVEEPLPSAVADPDRIGRLFENLFRNSVEHGSTSSRTQSDDSVEHGSTSSRAGPDDSVEHGSTSSRTQSDDSVEHGTAGSGTDAEQPPIGVTVGPLTDRSTCGFYVADDGPGIPSAERDRVFEPGFSLDGDGTGLGLPIVSRIAALHGWSVDVTDGPDGGARFEISGLASPEDD